MLALLIGWGNSTVVIVVWICISLMICDVEHLFMCLLALCIFSLEKCLFSKMPIFIWGYLVVWYWVVWVLCMFWILAPYRIYGLQIFFFFSFYRLSFYLVDDWSLLLCGSFLVWCSPTFFFLILLLVLFKYHIKKKSLQGQWEYYRVLLLHSLEDMPVKFEGQTQCAWDAL